MGKALVRDLVWRVGKTTLRPRDCNAGDYTCGRQGLVLEERTTYESFSSLISMTVTTLFSGLRWRSQ